MSKRIWHIGGLNISRENHTNLKYSFYELVKKIKNEPGILVICGRIFAYKAYLSSDDIFVFQMICALLAKENIQTIIVPGEDDYNLSNTFVKENISLLVKNYNIHYYVSPIALELVDYPGVEFHIYPPNAESLKTLNETNLKVALSQKNAPNNPIIL
jgi:hypothetical protein